MIHAMRDSDLKEFMKEEKFKKVPYKKEWEKDGWKVFLYKNHLEFRSPNGRLVGKYLVYLEWNNFFNFKCAVRDLTR